MKEFIQTLIVRNESLFWFGLICLLLSLVFISLTKFSNTKVLGINAWIKPFKFAFSTFLYAWAMAWFIGYLNHYQAAWFNWVIIITLGFEIIYIALQASKGQLSHFNLSTPLYATLYSLMAAAASIATLATAYIGLLFFGNEIQVLPDHYLWSIRLGIFLFVIFSFEGFVMGAKLKHTIGGPDGGEGLPLLNWSKKFGDPRVAHFIGMHALQVIPFLSFYFFKSTLLTFVLAIVYGLLALFTLFQALQGRPFIRGKT
jgi:hypothetical protein